MTWFWMLLELVVNLWSSGILSGLIICGVLSLKVNRVGNIFSSQDSLGATPQTSENLYDNVINQHPINILALNHETIGSFALFIYLIMTS
jgi:hypothetical protein